MEILSTPLKDCWLIKNTIFPDDRGYFLETFNHKKFSAITGWEGSFVQDNQSASSYGVVRGLHFQMGEHAQAKLVRVLQGKVLDVAIDLRPDSPTFGKSFSFELTESNEFQLFVPRGFAHGFSVISEQATFFYKCDNYYHKAAENGIHPLDVDLNVNWQISADHVKLSDKDKAAQSFKMYLASL